MLEAASILVSMNENDKKPDGEGNNSLGSSKQILSPTLAHKSPGHDQIMSPPSSYQKPVASGGYLDASKNENHIQGKHQSRDKSHEDEDYDADEGVFGELE